MGGTVPLGYDAKDRTLVINEPEAETVRELFQLYLQLGTVRQVTEEANRRGLRTKLREDLDSRMRGGLPFYRGHIYRILTNPLYIGQIQHKKDTYPGLHPAIIDPDTWDAVQQRMNTQRVTRRRRTNAKHPSPLAGKIFDGKGRPFTPSHAAKNGRRYRYYVEQAATQKPKPKDGRSYRRIPAAAIEELTLCALIKMLRTPAEVLKAGGIENPTPSEMPIIISKATALAQRLADEKLEASHDLLRDLILRICIGTTSVDIKISTQAMREHLDIIDVPSISEDQAFEISVPATIKSRGTELKFVITDPAHKQKQNLDQTLIRAIVRAHVWVDEITSGKVEGIKVIALREKLNERYVRRILDLAFLAPDITHAILDGTQPENLMLQGLMVDGVIPWDWAQQRRLFHFV